MLKILVSLIVGLVVGAGVTAFLLPEKNAISPLPVRAGSCPVSSLENTNLIDELQQENRALNDALKKINIERKKPLEIAINKQPSEQQNRNCAAEINTAITALNEKDKIVAELQSATSLHNYDENLYAKFSNEELNPDWAKKTENTFYDAFSKNPDTQSIIISSLNCRSKTCKINIAAADQSAKNHLAEIISQPSVLKALGFNNATARPAMEISGGEMTLYLSNGE